MKKGMDKSFGSYIQSRRIAQGYTLREFCKRFGLDSAYISRLENDIIPAPQKNETLRGIAKALSIEENSEEWVAFFDLASISRNEFPEDIKNSFEKNLHLLPALLRASKNNNVPKEKVLQLISELRDENEPTED